jgi:hypothetical protein
VLTMSNIRNSYDKTVGIGFTQLIINGPVVHKTDEKGNNDSKKLRGCIPRS